MRTIHNVSSSQVKEWVSEESYFAFPWPDSVKVELQIHQSCGLLSQTLEENVKMTGFNHLQLIS